MTSRIPVTPETHTLIKDYAKGLGGSFDEALNFLFEKVYGGAAGFDAGDDDRREFRDWQRKRSNNEPENKK